MTSTTPDFFRRPHRGSEDALFRRCLAAAALAGALLVVAIRLAPVRHAEITRVDQLSRRFARLILEPPVPRALPAVPSFVPPGEHERVGTGSGSSANGAARTAMGTAGEPVANAGGARHARGPASLDPGAGGAGRARAQAEVASALGDARAPVASALEGLSDALGGAGGNVVASAGRAERVRTIRAARPDEPVAGAAAGIGSASAPDLGHSVVVGGPVGVGGRSPGFGGRGGAGAGGGSVAIGAGAGVFAPGGGTGGNAGGGEPGGRASANGAPDGPRSNAALLTVIQKYSAGIQYCYSTQLKHDPTLRGKLVVALTVSASGEVTQASVVQNTIGSPELVECALAQIREWRFPSVPEGVSSFRAPFVFTPPN